MQDLTYDTIIPELNKIFPDFANDNDLEKLTAGLPGVHLGFFISYAREHWHDRLLHDRLILFFERLCESEDETTRITFQDFALDFQLHFEEHDININSFLEKLSPKTKLEFEAALNFWKTANKKYKADGS